MPTRNDRPFVKSADTSTSVIKSRGDLDKLLRRYGASSISVHEDIVGREILVSFIVPDSRAKDAPPVPVRLPISVTRVYWALYGRPANLRAYDAKRIQQAERVAWRNLVLWIDAALSAASVGLQTITEAFFAHAVVDPDGTRMIDRVEQYQGQLGSGVQRLLTSGADVTIE